jgi:F-box and WD-40 domain protein 1/11
MFVDLESTEYVMSIINTLPTSKICEIVQRVRPRLYIDFFQYLPPEVCLKILGFLDPTSLINTARASREWMLLALDRKLWEQLYILEGFRVIRSEVQSFEDALNSDRPRSSDGLPNKKRTTPLRVLPSIGDGDSEMMEADEPMIKQESLFGPLRDFKFDIDEKMTDLPILPSLQSPKSSQFPSRFPTSSLQDRNSRRLSAASVLPKNSHPLSTISSLVVLDRGDNKKKLNWQYLYSQRRRLEANWENEKYTNFQLPHPSHPEEAHKECIYTIQHSGKYLVSGSRDKTLRIWNLDTRRLMRPPLAAHNGSVLCLQFDASPEEDLIVSGSSDATVVLWKFSTGQVIQRLRKAHRESVLNVRFDKHVLVTCSKDKTIKIFNRRPLNPGDLGYPDASGAVHPAPMYLSGGVNPVPTYLNNYGYNPAPTAGLATKPAYTMIGCLEGHGAAVNAVQIHGHEVVSASGDRTVKVWNWPEQTCTRTLIGHTKGIACVQYDGRRIVSGSSDNEVKVFDKESGLEIASLRAHSNLVRTVQAGFGDLPYSEEEDKEDAKATDYEYFKAVDAGTISRTSLLQRGRPRNAGSRKPEDITAYGAKLPPGGGGGRFGRIVSGSYDETIIIWRRDKEGAWKAQHTLRQEEAAHVASRAITRRTEPAAAVAQPTQPAASQNAPTAPQQPTAGSSILDVNVPTEPFAPGSASFYHHVIDLSIAHGEAGLEHALQAHPQMLTYHSHLLQRINALPEPIRTKMIDVVENAIDSQQSLTGNHHSGTTDSGLAALASGWATAQNSQSSTQGQASTSSSTSTQTAQAPAQMQVTHGPLVQTPQPVHAQLPTAPHVGTHAPVATHPAPVPVPQPAPVHANHHLPANMARVFKLQFDARRIICCSQASVIVGWDFANGDEQIIEASRFFAPIE